MYDKTLLRERLEQIPQLKKTLEHMLEEME
jgi:hypothetical protein